MDVKKEKKINIILILLLVLVLILIGGGTMAWLSWRSENNTSVSFEVAGGTLTIDGGGDITGFNMAPTSQCNHETYAIKREINASAMNGTNNDMMAYIQLYTNNTLFPNVYKMKNLEWVISSSSTDCTNSNNILASGNFKNIDNSSDTSNKDNTPMDLITFSVPKGQTINKTYYLYIWVNEDYVVENVGDTVTNSIQGVEFIVQLTGKLDNTPIPSPSEFLNGAIPVLESGMVPITLSVDGVATSVFETDENWYDYQNKEWANAVLVDSSVRSTYINNDGTINGGLTIPEEKILAYYVWIPRYKYKLWITDPTLTSSPQTIDIVFESKDTSKSSGTSVGEYLTHPAFTFGEKGLNGIWVGKFELGENTTKPQIKPNVRSFRLAQKLSAHFQKSIIFAGGTMDSSTGIVTFSGNNTYGLTANTDSHMMKNSEWGAVAYLSHSQYGIDEEVYVNNSYDSYSGFYTGRSGGNVSGSVNTLVTQFPDSQTSTAVRNEYGYYTWTGQIIDSLGNIGGYAKDRTLGTNASTTGNVTGVYDMVGGADEYVMGNYNNTLNSYFTTLPEKKYYDVYTGTSNSTCTIEECGGHALYETKGWYSDSSGGFVNTSNPWFKRYDIFTSSITDGNFCPKYCLRDYNYSWRSVIVDGD